MQDKLKNATVQHADKLKKVHMLSSAKSVADQAQIASVRRLIATQAKVVSLKDRQLYDAQQSLLQYQATNTTNVLCVLITKRRF